MITAVITRWHEFTDFDIFSQSYQKNHNLTLNSIRHFQHKIHIVNFFEEKNFVKSIFQRIIFSLLIKMHLLRQVISKSRIVTNFGQYSHRFVSSTAAQSTVAEPLRVPVPDGAEAPPNPKLQAIVNNIATLNLLEVSELSALLKKTLNLPDAPMVAFGAGAAAPAQASAEEEEVGSGPAIVQTSFRVRLNSFDDSKKIVLIKELKNQCEGMNLVQAKKFIESAPAIVKEDLSKDEAEALKAALEKFGASVEVL